MLTFGVLGVERTARIAKGAPELWRFVQSLIRDAIEQGYFDAG